MRLISQREGTVYEILSHPVGREAQLPASTDRNPRAEERKWLAGI